MERSEMFVPNFSPKMARNSLFFCVLYALSVGQAQAEVIPCERSDELVIIDEDSVLEPGCVYRAGIEIVGSDIHLDCQGALIQDTTGHQRRGIHITTSADIPQSNILVENCEVEGFLNNMRVSREGFKSFVEGMEYEGAGGNIILQNSTLRSSRGSGIFINAYVVDVTMRNLEIVDSGGVGIYLEAGSKDNLIEESTLVGNGYAEVEAGGIPQEAGPITFYYMSTGREGIAVDGSRNNIIRYNHIAGNSAGGIFLYKNCGEFYTEEPEDWWTRPYGSTGNQIIGNTIVNEKHGIWVGSRMAQNQYFMDCSDPAYFDYPMARLHLDYAADNHIEGNLLEDVKYGIRIEDDGNQVIRNLFTGGDSSHRAILLGTKFRTNLLEAPVSDTVITKNISEILGSPSPFTWMHGHENTLFEDNKVGSREVALRQGRQPLLDPHLFVESFWIDRSELVNFLP